MTENDNVITLNRGRVFEDTCGEPFHQDEVIRELLANTFTNTDVNVFAIRTLSQYKQAVKYLMESLQDDPQVVEKIMAIAMYAVRLTQKQLEKIDSFPARSYASALKALADGTPGCVEKAKRTKRIIDSGLRPVSTPVSSSDPSTDA
jgi:hypothetical protein